MSFTHRQTFHDKCFRCCAHASDSLGPTNGSRTSSERRGGNPRVEAQVRCSVDTSDLLSPLVAEKADSTEKNYFLLYMRRGQLFQRRLSHVWRSLRPRVAVWSIIGVSCHICSERADRDRQLELLTSTTVLLQKRRTNMSVLAIWIRDICTIVLVSWNGGLIKMKRGWKISLKTKSH